MSSLHTAETTGRIEEPGRHNNSRYDELREILEKHRLGLTKEFESGKQRDQDEVGQAGGVRDLGEIAEGASQAYVRAEMLDMKSVGIANVDRALDSLKSGTYGYCLECREEIPDQRLRALPFADHCLGCAEKQEENRSQRAKVGYRGT